MSLLRLFMLLGCATSTGVLADTWPGWRGMAGHGVSQETNLPVEWSETSHVLWSMALRGKGNSSPAVTQHRVFATSQDETDESLWVTCLESLTGKLLWEKQAGTGGLVGSGPPNLFKYRHNPATSSPAADEQHVVAFFGTGDLLCLDHSGNELWRKNIPETYGAYDIKFGVATSPRLWGTRLFLACLHKGPSYVVAFDVDTGRELWLTPRN